MTQQISLRLPEKLLKDAKKKAEMYGFSSVQEYIAAEIRGDLYGEKLTEKEYELVNRMLRYVKDHPEDLIPGEELFARLHANANRNSSGKKTNTKVKRS